MRFNGYIMTKVWSWYLALKHGSQMDHQNSLLLSGAIIDSFLFTF